MRIEESINLQNARQRIKNENLRNPKNHNCISKAKLGRLIWPDQKGKRPLTSMSNVIKGNTPTIRITWVYLICKHCGVDPNFLYGKPSKHDEDFEKLCNK